MGFEINVVAGSGLQTISFLADSVYGGSMLLLGPVKRSLRHAWVLLSSIAGPLTPSDRNSSSSSSWVPSWCSRPDLSWNLCTPTWSESESRSGMSDSLGPHGLYSPWNSPGQNTGVGSLFLLQRIFPTQGSNPGLLHFRQILYQLSHKEIPRTLGWVAYPFSSISSWPRNRTRDLLHCRQILYSLPWAIREAHVLLLRTGFRMPAYHLEWPSLNQAAALILYFLLPPLSSLTFSFERCYGKDGQGVVSKSLLLGSLEEVQSSPPRRLWIYYNDISITCLLFVFWTLKIFCSTTLQVTYRKKFHYNYTLNIIKLFFWTV